MNRELELKLQAYLDGELSARQARRLAAWIHDNPQAQALVAELKMTQGLLKNNEPELSLPESREFYWSKIERAILHSDPPEKPTLWHILAAWRKWLAPLAGTALVVFLALATIPHFQFSDSSLAEVENLSEYTGSFSFRSHSENMFVVWVYDKTQPADPESEPMYEDDIFVQ